MKSDSVYGRIVEHPEYPIEDERRFTVTIKQHEYVGKGLEPLSLRRQYGCERCGFPKDAKLHNMNKYNINIRPWEFKNVEEHS